MKQTIELNGDLKAEINNESVELNQFRYENDKATNQLVKMSLEDANNLREWLNKNLPRS